jgi:hypothetical protein
MDDNELKLRLGDGDRRLLWTGSKNDVLFLKEGTSRGMNICEEARLTIISSRLGIPLILTLMLPASLSSLLRSNSIEFILGLCFLLRYF